MAFQLRLPSICLAFAPACLLLTTLTASAADGLYKGDFSAAPQTTEAFAKPLDDGLYIGVDLGYDSYRIHTNINASTNGDTITGNPPIAATGFVGGLFLGYGEYFRELLYLGGEAFVNISGASSSNVTLTDALAGSTYNTKLSVGTSFGFGLLPGIKLNESSLVYIRLAGIWADFQDQESFSSGGVANSTTPSCWIPGFTYGLGMETALYKNWSVRAEYTHTTYNDSSYTTFGTRYSPYDNQLMLALVYHVF